MNRQKENQNTLADSKSQLRESRVVNIEDKHIDPKGERRTWDEMNGEISIYLSIYIYTHTHTRTIDIMYEIDIHESPLYI